MNLPQENEVVYEATLVEHHSQKKSGPSLGCIIGMVFGSVFLLMVVGMAILVAVISPQMLAPPAVVTLQEDLSEVKEFFGTDGTPVSDHPDFKQIDQFVKLMASRLDDTANSKVRKMIDHRRIGKRFPNDQLQTSTTVNFRVCLLYTSDAADE